MEFARLSVVCVIAACIAVLIKPHAPAIAVLLGAFVSVSVLSACFFRLLPFAEFIEELLRGTSFPSYINVLIKVCGIGVLTKTASEICADAGESVYAGKVRLIGKTAILLSALPVMRALFEMIKDLMT